MIMKSVRTFLVLVLFFTFTAPAGAAQIVYDSSGRPIEFHGLMVDGRSWHVKVTWTGTMRGTYGAKGSFMQPEYWGDNAGATLAAQAMQQALIDDGFNPTGSRNYLWIPVSLSGWYIGPGVWLHTENLDIKQVNVNYDNHYGTVGYTQFYFFKDGFEGPGNPGR